MNDEEMFRYRIGRVVKTFDGRYGHIIGFYQGVDNELMIYVQFSAGSDLSDSPERRPMHPETLKLEPEQPPVKH